MNPIKIRYRLPEDFIEYTGTEIMSNFDGVICHATENTIQGKPLYSRYAGWHFNGLVWRQDDLWHCDVWQYRSYRETFSAETLEEIMALVSEEYGYE